MFDMRIQDKDIGIIIPFTEIHGQFQMIFTIL